MANNLKDANSLTEALEKLNKTLDNTEKVNNKIFNNYDKRVRKATKQTDEMTDSYKTFRKILEGTSNKGIADAMSDMPKYIQGVTKMTSSFKSYAKEVDHTGKMFKTMGISFNKTFKDLEVRSSGVSKSMSTLVTKANKLATVKDSLMDVPKQLKLIQDSMEATPEIKVSSIENLSEKIDGLKDNISDVDFKNLQGQMEKIEKGGDAEAIYANIQKKLSQIKVKPVKVGGEEEAKRAVEAVGAEVNKLSSLSPGDELINNFLGNINELRKDDSFSKVTGQYKTEIEEFEKLIAKPGVTYQEVSESMMNLNEKLSGSMSGYFDNFDKKASHFEKQMQEIKESQQELSDSFKDGHALTVNTGDALASFDDMLNHMETQAYLLQANNIIPDEQLLKSKEMQDGIRKLASLQEENLKIQNNLSASEEDREGTLEDIQKEQKKNKKAIQEQVKHMKELESVSQDYAKHMGEASEKGFGQKKAEGFSNKLFGISGSLKKMGADMGEGSPMGKGLNLLGKSAGRFGGALRKLAFPIAVITSAISLGKLLLQLEARYAAMSQEAVDSGAMIGKSAADVGKAMDDMNIKATNLSGLYEAASGGREFALSRKEIMGVSAALNDAGLASRNLEGQMKNVKTTAEGAGNEFLGAANVVTKFSHNLGLSKGAVAGMMGDMAFEFDSTMGTMSETFVDLTAAMSQSGMSSNRFFATIQSATAGLSFYEEQLASTANMVAHLGKNTGLTDAEIGKVAKTVTEFASNTDQAIKAFAVVAATDPEAFGEMAAMAQKSIDDITVKMEKTSDPKELKKLKAQKENALLMKDALDNKNIAEAGTLLKYASADLQANVVGGLADFADKATSGMGIFEKEKMYDAMGIGEMQKMAQARGDNLADSLKDQEKISGSSKAQDDKAFNIDQKTGNARNKLIEGVQTRLTIGFGSVVTTLLLILTAISAGSLFGGKGGGLAGLFKKGGGGMVDMIKNTGKMGVGSAASSVGTALKSFGGSALNVVKGAGPALAAFTAAASSMYNVFDMFKTGPIKWEKELQKNVNDRSIVSNLLHPIDYITAKLNNVVGGFLDWVGVGEVSDSEMKEHEDKIRKKQAARRKKDLDTVNMKRRESGETEFKGFSELVAHRKSMRAGNVPSAGAGITPSLGNLANGASNLNMSTAKGGSTTNASTTHGPMTNVININGGDLENVRKVVLDTVERRDRERNK